MKRRKIIEYLKHPELLQELSIKELQQWIKDFPYSANLRTLLAQKIKLEGKEGGYPEILHDAAMYSPDRAKLYDTIEQPQKGIVALGFDDAGEDQPFTEDQLKLDQVIPDQDHTMVRTPDETHMAELDELNVIGAAAIAGGAAAILSNTDDINQETAESESESIDEVQNMEDIPLIGDDLPQETDQLETEDQQAEPIADKAVETIQDEISSDTIDDASHDILSDMDDQSLVEPGADLVDETPASAYDRAVEESFYPDSTPESDQSQQDIVEIPEEKEPEVSKRKSGLSDYSRWLIELETRSIVDDIEDEDGDEDQEIISESLARILYSQGHNNRAIDMYQKLMLKYPEKSTYFAAQIEKIKAS